MVFEMSSDNDSFDTPWKEIIEFFFPQFMAFFVPGSEKDIDWEKGIRFLDTEFQQISKDSKAGRRHTDKLVEVTLKGGFKKWILIHVEVQAQKEDVFAERMFVYNYRIYERFKIPVTSIAVLADDQPNWRPEGFRYGMWGCRMELDYLKIKLLDYKDKWSYLENSDNPFAIVVMAHLKALESRKDNSLRQQWKIELTKFLYQKGYSKDEILKLYKFIDWVLSLPKDLEKDFLEEIKAYEREKKMPYITSAERIGWEEGEKVGREEGSYSTLLQLIKNLRKNEFSDEAIAKVTNLDVMSVKKILNNEYVDLPLHLFEDKHED